MNKVVVNASVTKVALPPSSTKAVLAPSYTRVVVTKVPVEDVYYYLAPWQVARYTRVVT